MVYGSSFAGVPYKPGSPALQDRVRIPLEQVPPRDNYTWSQGTPATVASDLIIYLLRRILALSSSVWQHSSKRMVFLVMADIQVVLRWRDLCPGKK